MDSLFKKGAFQGVTATQAYFVKCDSETNDPAGHRQRDREHPGGIRRRWKPAEFVVIQIESNSTGQASA